VLSKAALWNYINLGKLIKIGEYKNWISQNIQITIYEMIRMLFLFWEGFDGEKIYLLLFYVDDLLLLLHNGKVKRMEQVFIHEF
jgi:hypothetical protein